MNILLDANWSVKIGDFGLATKDLFAAPETVDADDPVAEHKPHATTKRTSSGLTKDIGTHFYIAPEIQRNTSVSTKYYSAKIDVYRYEQRYLKTLRYLMPLSRTNMNLLILN